MVKKNLKHFVEKSFSVFEGAPFRPFEHTMIFSAKYIYIFFLLNNHKNAFYTNSRFVSQKYAPNKKERNF